MPLESNVDKVTNILIELSDRFSSKSLAEEYKKISIVYQDELGEERMVVYQLRQTNREKMFSSSPEIETDSEKINAVKNTIVLNSLGAKESFTYTETGNK